MVLINLDESKNLHLESLLEIIDTCDNLSKYEHPKSIGTYVDQINVKNSKETKNFRYEVIYLGPSSGDQRTYEFTQQGADDYLRLKLSDII